MNRYLWALLTAFAVCSALMPIIIRLAKKLKLRQTVLCYVTEHIGKSGTPTMGGIGIILSLATAFFFLNEKLSVAAVALAVTAGYGIVGFLDDFIKVYYRRNEGLSALQKIIFQVAIAIIVSVYAYKNELIGSSVYLGFGSEKTDLGVFALPLYVFVFLAFTNSVNLTDGLDGLAGKVTATYLFFFAACVFVTASGQVFIADLLVYCASLLGGIIGFLCYNSYPAKIFMGDTGSLALGGGLACLCIFTGRIAPALLIGAVYIATALSVIIQVGYYKLTKKRVFLMAPLHHHFQKKGLHENHIVTLYTAATFVVGLIALILGIAA